MNHFVIVLDGNNHELYRTTVNQQDRPDVQKVYPNAPIAGKGGFSVKVPESRLFNTDTLQLVSRYTNDKNGEPNGGADFWFPKIQTKAGWLDQFKTTGNQITVAGWHADDASAEGTHYLILFDRTKNHEIARQVVKNAASDDVAKAYPRIANANKARFTASFAINPSMLNNDELVLISRYSNPQDVNKQGGYSDYWFNNVVQLNNNKAGYLDNFYVDGANNRVVVSGWHADGRSTLDTNHFLILFDQTTNREVGRQKVNVTASNDVAANGYGNISNADQCRFSTTFNVTPVMVGHRFVVISRYSNDKNNGEGDRSDIWFGNQINLNGNQAWLDNFSQNGTTINVSGWHADDYANAYKHHFILLFDWTKGKEITRKEVINVASSDIQNAYGNILGSNRARFSTSFTINPADVHDAFQIISRYSNRADGEGLYSQNYIGNRLLNVYQNPGWMYQINYTQIQANPAEVGHNIGPGYEGVKTYLIKSKLGDANIHNQYTYGDGYAIANFQRSHGLPATGWVDLNTWKALGYSADLWYGIDSYVSPTLTNPAATRQQRIDAMIGAAYQYMGKP